MTAYDNDPRVHYNGGGIYEIHLEGDPYGIVQPCDDNYLYEAFTWTNKSVKQEFRSADEAIRSLIGDPQ